MRADRLQRPAARNGGLTVDQTGNSVFSSCWDGIGQCFAWGGVGAKTAQVGIHMGPIRDRMMF
jgi:hypothetical protein